MAYSNDPEFEKKKTYPGSKTGGPRFPIKKITPPGGAYPVGEKGKQ
jgi:hypothetical protein